MTESQEQKINVMQDEISRVKHTYFNFEKLLSEVDDMSIEDAKNLIRKKLISLEEIESKLHQQMRNIREEQFY